MKELKQVFMWLGIVLTLFLIGTVAYIDINHTHEVYRKKLPTEEQTLTKLVKQTPPK